MDALNKHLFPQAMIHLHTTEVSLSIHSLPWIQDSRQYQYCHIIVGLWKKIVCIIMNFTVLQMFAAIKLYIFLSVVMYFLPWKLLICSKVANFNSTDFKGWIYFSVYYLQSHGCESSDQQQLQHFQYLLSSCSYKSVWLINISLFIIFINIIFLARLM